MERRCQYAAGGSPESYAGHWGCFDERACCGEVARCFLECGPDYAEKIWLCAEHYDLWFRTYMGGE